MSDKVEHPTRDGTVQVNLYHQLVSILSDIVQIDIDPSNGDITRKEMSVWDSINHLRLVLELEQVFQITLSDDEASALMSLREVEALLVRHGIPGSPEMDKRGSVAD